MCEDYSIIYLLNKQFKKKTDSIINIQEYHDLVLQEIKYKEDIFNDLKRINEELEAMIVTVEYNFDGASNVNLAQQDEETIV